jgi:hypothetical protein
MSQSVFELLEVELREARRLRDEVRVKLHLLGMEAREVWPKLEHRLVEIEERMETAGRGSATELLVALERLNNPFRALRDRLHADGSTPQQRS